MNIEVPDKDCQSDCRYRIESEMTTLAAYTPIFDKNGNNLNPNPNTISGKMFCSTCNRVWSYRRQYEKYFYEEPRDLTSSVESGIIDSVEVDTGC